MRPETARQLRRAIWSQRLRSYGPTVGLVLACVVLGGYLFNVRIDRSDPTVALTQINGTILDARRVAGRAAVFIAHVKLDTGKEVDADSTLAAVLRPSERVTVSEARHASGKLSYHVLQVMH